MILYPSSIPSEGIEIDFTQKEGWVRERLNQALGERTHPEDAIQGHVSVQKTIHNLFVSVDLHLPIHATCNRCLIAYDDTLDVHVRRLFVPLYRSEKRRDVEKDAWEEITKEDLDFSYYEGDEIDLGDLIAEHVLLEQPIVYLCRKECKGLCPRCGANLNEQTCLCPLKGSEDSPFAVLKKLKM